MQKAPASPPENFASNKADKLYFACQRGALVPCDWHQSIQEHYSLPKTVIAHLIFKFIHFCQLPANISWINWNLPVVIVFQNRLKTSTKSCTVPIGWYNTSNPISSSTSTLRQVCWQFRPDQPQLHHLVLQSTTQVLAKTQAPWKKTSFEKRGSEQTNLRDEVLDLKVIRKFKIRTVLVSGILAMNTTVKHHLCALRRKAACLQWLKKVPFEGQQK